MRNHVGGTQVPGGYYLNRREWDFATVSGKEGTLPGGPEDRFIRVPVLGLMLFAPIMGLLFVVFMPFIGFALAAYALTTKLGAWGRKLGGQLVSTMAPAFRPGEAYFAGEPKGEEPKSEPAKREDGLKELEREIAERRRAEEAQGR